MANSAVDVDMHMFAERDIGRQNTARAKHASGPKRDEPGHLHAGVHKSCRLKPNTNTCYRRFASQPCIANCNDKSITFLHCDIAHKLNRDAVHRGSDIGKVVYYESNRDCVSQNLPCEPRNFAARPARAKDVQTPEARFHLASFVATRSHATTAKHRITAAMVLRSASASVVPVGNTITRSDTVSV